MLRADEAANMNFYSLIGVSAKVIDFTDEFLENQKKLSNGRKTKYTNRSTAVFAGHEISCRLLTDYKIKVY